MLYLSICYGGSETMQDADSEDDLYQEEVSTNIEERYRSLNDRKFISFSWTLPNWEPNNFHWNTPSRMTIWNDGEWLIYSEHLAHQRPSAKRRRFLCAVVFFDSSGNQVHSNEYVLASLTHRQQLWNKTSTSYDTRLGDLLSSIQSATLTQWIKK